MPAEVRRWCRCCARAAARRRGRASPAPRPRAGRCTGGARGGRAPAGAAAARAAGRRAARRRGRRPRAGWAIQSSSRGSWGCPARPRRRASRLAAGLGDVVVRRGRGPPWRAHEERVRPCSDSRSTRSASSWSPNASAPPSNVVMFFVAWNENAARLPWAPMRRPRHSAPIACAASSTTAMPWRLANAATASRSTGWPARCTGISTRVARRHLALGVGEVDQPGVRLAVDQHRGRAEVHDGVGARREGQRRHQHLVAGPTPSTCSAEPERRRAGAQAAHVRGAARSRRAARWNSATRGPVISQPLRMRVRRPRRSPRRRSRAR